MISFNIYKPKESFVGINIKGILIKRNNKIANANDILTTVTKN